VSGPERFAPGVVVDGRVYTPEGWEWILGFALAGCEWAVQEAAAPDFRERILKSLQDRRRMELRAIIDERLAEVGRLREDLRRLDDEAGGRA
jgi:hypothetical protein